MVTPGIERRIAERGAVGPILVSFRAPERRSSILGGLRSRTVTESGYLVNLSVSGAAVVVREIKGLPLRSRVEICHEGVVATAVVRRMVARVDGRVLYGVDFTSLDPGMRDFVFDHVEARRPSSLEKRWTRAQ